MMEKIEWYQEILKLDPDSRAFFPLAKLLRESQQPEKAVEVLRAGLQHSSVFVEARLLLIQILFEQSRSDECAGELSAVTDLLEAYPAFWEVWADSVAGKNRDLALAIRLMASTVRHPERSLSQILECGLELLQDVRRTFATSPAVPQQEQAFTSKSAQPEPAQQESAVSESTPDPVGESSSVAPLLPPLPVAVEAVPACEPEPLPEPVDTHEATPLAAECPHPVESAEPVDLLEPIELVEQQAPEHAEESGKPGEPSELGELGESFPAEYQLPVFLEEEAALSDEDMSDYDADDLSDEATVRTRSMADILAAQGDVVGALEIYQELEAAAPTPEEARELHDSVVALAARIAGNGMDGEQTENAPPSDTGSQNNLMSLLESLADRLEARARV